MFHYISGDEVCIGDVVRCYAGGPLERVAVIFARHSEDAKAFSCSERGGILIKPLSLLVEPGSPDWEDLEFVSRGA